MPAADREPHFVRSFERGLSVIRAFDADHAELTLSQVARACDLTRAAARRFLLTLADLGYVRTDGRLFRLSPRVLELGYAYLSSLTLPQIAQPHLEQLAARTGESASLCVLDGDDVVYVARVPTRRIMTATITLGTRFPAHVTSHPRARRTHLTGVRAPGPAAASARLGRPDRRRPGDGEGTYRSSTNRRPRHRDTQIIIVSPASRSVSVSTESRWSGVPSSTSVSQVPQVPSVHE